MKPLSSLIAVSLSLAAACSQQDERPQDDRSRVPRDGWEGEFPEFAELVWTYRPSDPTRELLRSLQPVAVEGRVYAVTSRQLESPPAERGVETSITALDADGTELWHAPMPRATRTLAPPLVDSQGHVWFFSEDAKENVGRWGDYAYRVAPDGRVLWEVSLRGALEDATAFITGLRTKAAALDRHNNAYYVIGKSAASIGPDGKHRWGRLLGLEETESRCGLPLLSPLVASDRVFFAEACTGVVVYDLEGNEVGRFDWQWPGTPMATSEGWLVAASGYELDSGTKFQDYQGVVRMEWPAVTQSRDIIFGPQGTAFSARLAADVQRAELVAWLDGNESWSFILDDALGNIIASEDAKILLSLITLGRMAIVDRQTGEIVFNMALGRPGVVAVPVSARPGEWVFLSNRSYEDQETVLTSVKAPVAPPASGSWSRLHANQRNSRSLDQ